jgi:hypothetical protein
VIDEMRTELVEQPEMRAFGDVIVVQRTEHRTERIGIGQPPVTAGITRVIAQRLTLFERQAALEEAAFVAPGEFAGFLAGQRMGSDELGMRDEAAGDKALVDLVHTQDSERVAMRARENRRDITG